MHRILILCIFILGVAANAAAHKYFFGITNLTVNAVSEKLEIVHHFTAHDLENAIAELKQVHFSPEREDYEQTIQQYIEDHFSLSRDNELLALNWVGIEVDRGKIIIYQETTSQNFLSGLVVKNDILTNTYVKQVNTVNYQDSAVKGSLTFDKTRNLIKIENKN